MSSKELMILDGWDNEINIISKHIKNQYGGVKLEILEAGCGQSWGIDLDNIEYRLTGIDIDKAALEIRNNKFDDLDEIVEGDLRFAKFPDASFDIIFNSFVLEHIDGAEGVINNFVNWLKPNGIAIIRIPDPYSVRGFITRITPHWFHVLCYRYLFNRPDAGKLGYAPYPVYYDYVCSHAGIEEFAKNNNLSIVAIYGVNLIDKSHNRILNALVSTLIKLFGCLSLGFLKYRHTNLLFILKKI